MLYLVATPIGNLSDITLRAIEVLKTVDFVASEDTRRTGFLLKHLGISKPQIAFHEHNERRATPRILELLYEGKAVALVADAGTPCVSDPGFILVRAVIEAGLEVTMIPGPAALVMAVVLSGLPIHSFTYRGFPPHKGGPRRRFLAIDAESPHTLVFYESPYRLRVFLEDALTVLGDRRAAVAKELTKVFETIKRGPISEILSNLEETPKGEYVIVIEGAKEGQEIQKPVP
jgi:16S rRNA (cytidine1402-2'-O)-methyltransferase